MKTVLDEIKEKLRPELKVLSEIDEFVSKINSLIKKSGFKAECVKGGSTAKGTFLKDDYDVDLFVRFDYSYKDEDLSEMLEKIIASLKPERVHGSRDYFQVKNKLVFEIVPVLKIDNYKKAINVTDMSPLHVTWVKKHVYKQPSLKDEIRLAKQFCKSVGVYGAESYIQGFSGHVLDILIIYYGGFEKLLSAAAKWKNRTIVDIEKHLKDPVKELNKSKTVSPLIVVDPLQPDRNAAAAVSREKYELFIRKAQEFISSPNKSFFTIKSIDVDALIKDYKNDWTIFVEAEPTDDKKDVAGSKLLKIFVHIRKLLKKHDFKIIKAGWEFKDKALMFYILKKEELSKEVVRWGPPKREKEDYEKFKSKHKKTFVDDNRICATLKREYLIPSELVKDLLKKEYIKEKAKKLSMKSS